MMNNDLKEMEASISKRRTTLASDYAPFSAKSLQDSKMLGRTDTTLVGSGFRKSILNFFAQLHPREAKQSLQMPKTFLAIEVRSL